MKEWTSLKGSRGYCRYKNPAQYKFGSVEWQNAMAENITHKKMAGKKLDDYEKVFMDMQHEHNKRVMRKTKFK
jgi:hypothetical protein